MGDMIKGNIAVAEAAVRAGIEVYAGYPITPSTEVMEYLSDRLPALGRTFIQAESELAAINMVLGVSACGRRVLTASSGPGISLKQEGISYMAQMNFPCVILMWCAGATAWDLWTARRRIICGRPGAAATGITATSCSAPPRCRRLWI